MLFGKHVNKYYKKYGVLMLLGVIVLLIVDYISTKIPRKFSEIIDSFESSAMTIEKLNGFLLSFLVLVAIMAVGRMMWRFFLIGTSRGIQHDMRKQLFSHATSLDQPYYQTHKVGAVMAYFSNDLEAIRHSFGRGLLLILDGIFMSTIIIIRMLEMDYKLTLISTIPMFFLGVTAFFIIKKMRLIFRTRQDSFQKMNEFTQESFSGIQVIKAFVREAKEAFLFKERSEDFYNKHMDYVRTMVWVQIVINIFINLTAITIIVFGAYTAITNPANFSAGNLTEFFSLFGMLIWPVMAITQFANLRSQASASYSRVAEFLDSKSLLVDGETEIEIKGAISFNNLTFAYPDEPEIEVLKDVSFEIEAGEFVGVLGRTGSGKTTLVDLLLRIYNVDPKMILVDGVDIMELKIKAVRDGIAYVPQDNFLYSTTIKENISFSSKDIKDDEIIKAAQLADIYDNVIEFKEGFETILGERGTTVSGGQKQRISIARALVKEAPVLVFDDSVSAVDTDTEETILTNLKKTRKGKTTIIIAHRISTVRNLDKIVLLDKGKLSAVGSHQELMKTSELYRDLVKRQTLESVVSGDA
ncbi:MAG: ABC transporter ATP-binding protein [Acholeplasmataceae bacterium]|jgi:ATP-binding cassette subfamily B protein|nr:ABC transporter ATP-binding protein [Acholeplasmataceae bacterium]